MVVAACTRWQHSDAAFSIFFDQLLAFINVNLSLLV
jgi:hypothetical protein